jgi:hypothetical protein
VGVIRLRLLDPVAERGGDQIELAGDRADALALVEDQAHRSRLEIIGENPTGRRLRVSAIRDIVPTFRKMSTKPDQARFMHNAYYVPDCGLLVWLWKGLKQWFQWQGLPRTSTDSLPIPLSGTPAVSRCDSEYAVV